ncbi:DNA-binding protein HU [compost metagenome]
MKIDTQQTAANNTKVAAVNEDQASAASIQPSADMRELAKKVISGITRTKTGVSGPIAIVYKTDLFDLVKSYLEKNSIALSNRQLNTTLNAVFQAILALNEAGASVTIIGFGTFSVVARDERQTSKFGEAKTVPQKNYPSFTSGKVFKQVADTAVTAEPKGKLREKLGLKKPAAAPEKEEL